MVNLSEPLGEKPLEKTIWILYLTQDSLHLGEGLESQENIPSFFHVFPRQPGHLANQLLLPEEQIEKILALITERSEQAAAIIIVPDKTDRANQTELYKFVFERLLFQAVFVLQESSAVLYSMNLRNAFIFYLEKDTTRLALVSDGFVMTKCGTELERGCKSLLERGGEEQKHYLAEVAQALGGVVEKMDSEKKTIYSTMVVLLVCQEQNSQEVAAVFQGGFPKNQKENISFIGLDKTAVWHGGGIVAWILSRAETSLQQFWTTRKEWQKEGCSAISERCLFCL